MSISSPSGIEDEATMGMEDEAAIEWRVGPVGSVTGAGSCGAGGFTDFADRITGCGCADVKNVTSV